MAAAAKAWQRPELARIGLFTGGLVGLLLTPPFASAYFRSYGAGESRRAWLRALDGPLEDLGFFGAGRVTAIYHSYGLAYGLALLLVLTSLVVLSRRWQASRAESAGWRVILVGLALVTIGTFSDYGLPYNGPVPNIGFGLEMIGFLVVAIGTVILGIALRVSDRATIATCLTVGAIGPASGMLGMWALGHIPSGPGVLLMLGAVVAGFRGPPSRPRLDLLKDSCSAGSPN